MKATEAERQVIGCLVAGHAGASQAIRFEAEDFTHPAMRACFEAIVSCVEDGVDIEPSVVLSKIERGPGLKIVGGRDGLALLVSGADASAFDAHADTVNADARRRATIQVLGSTIAELNEGAELGDTVAQHMSAVGEASTSRMRQQGTSSQDAVVDAWRGFIQRSTNPRLPGNPTGIATLTELMNGGLQAKRLIVLAARPSHGKSMLALGMVDHMAVDLGIPVLNFSLEMPPEECAGRMISRRAGVGGERWQKGSRETRDIDAFNRAANEVARAPITYGKSGDIGGILAEASQWIATVEDQCAEACERNAIDGHPAVFRPLVMIDHIHCLPPGKIKNYVDFIAHVMRSSKDLARTRNVPVLHIAQMNRAIEHEKRQPRYSDLRGGGAIEEFGDTIAFLRRDPNSPRPDRAELPMTKHRDGPVGILYLRYDVQTGRFHPTYGA